MASRSACAEAATAGHGDGVGEVFLTPSKRRRARAASTVHRLWARTKWVHLAVEEEEEASLEAAAQRQVRAWVQAEVKEAVEGASQSQVLEVAGVLHTELAGVLKKTDVQVFADGCAALRKRMSELEAWAQSQVQEFAGLLRTELGGLAKSADVQVLVAGLADLKKQVEVELEKRIEAIEMRKNKANEGVRGRLDRVSESFGRQLHDLQTRLREVETVVDPVRGASEQEDESEVEAAAVRVWRERLREGMPVHLDGLSSRADLNGKAGWLGQWHADRKRWSVTVGDQSLLLKTENLVP